MRAVFEHFHREMESELRRAGSADAVAGLAARAFPLRLLAARRRGARARAGVVQRAGAGAGRGEGARPAHGRDHARGHPRPDQRTVLAAPDGFLPTGGVLPAVRVLLRPDGSLRARARVGAVFRDGRGADPSAGPQPDDGRHGQPAALGGNRRQAHGNGRQGPLSPRCRWKGSTACRRRNSCGSAARRGRCRPSRWGRS